MVEDNRGVKYARVILKLSGEALQGDQKFGVSVGALDWLVKEIKILVDKGVQVGIVIGGGNIFRGTALSESGLSRITGDQMGMLATVMNGLAVKDALAYRGVDSRVMSSIPVGSIVENYESNKAKRHFKKKRIVIFASGTGNPLFTTDSAACLRGIEVEADLVVKATKVDGVYDKDPIKHSDAVRFSQLTYDEVIDKRLAVMDLTAICLMREHNLPLRVFNMRIPGALSNIVKGDESVGTLISGVRMND